MTKVQELVASSQTNRFVTFHNLCRVKEAVIYRIDNHWFATKKQECAKTFISTHPFYSVSLVIVLQTDLETEAEPCTGLETDEVEG